MSTEGKSTPSTKGPAAMMILSFLAMVILAGLDGIDQAWTGAAVFGFVGGFLWFIVQRFRQ